MDKDFVAFRSDSDHVSFVNIALVRRAVYHKDGKIITLIFSEAHQVEINGKDALAFLNRLMERGMALNGEPLTDIDRIKLLETP